MAPFESKRAKPKGPTLHLPWCLSHRPVAIRCHTTKKARVIVSRGPSFYASIALSLNIQSGCRDDLVSGRSRLDRSSGRSRCIGTASRSSRFAAGRDAAVAATGQQARTCGDTSPQVAQAAQQVQRRTAARISGTTAVGSVGTAARSSGNFVHAASWSSCDRSVGATRRCSSRASFVTRVTT